MVTAARLARERVGWVGCEERCTAVGWTDPVTSSASQVPLNSRPRPTRQDDWQQGPWSLQAFTQLPPHSADALLCCSPPTDSRRTPQRLNARQPQRILSPAPPLWICRSAPSSPNAATKFPTLKKVKKQRMGKEAISRAAKTHPWQTPFSSSLRTFRRTLWGLSTPSPRRSTFQ